MSFLSLAQKINFIERVKSTRRTSVGVTLAQIAVFATIAHNVVMSFLYCSCETQQISDKAMIPERI